MGRAQLLFGGARPTEAHPSSRDGSNRAGSKAATALL